MRRALAVFGFAGLLASAAAAVMVPNGKAAAAAEETFLIPASEGYGVADCLTNGAECGRVVANAWCEAQGYGLAASFGIAAPEDATASTGADSSARPISITCTR